MSDLYVPTCIISFQTAMDVVVNPPRPGEPSYELFMQVCVYQAHDIISDIHVYRNTIFVAALCFRNDMTHVKSLY